MRVTDTTSHSLQMTIVGDNNKSVTVTKYGSYWHMKHLANGQSKNFNHYHQAVSHLQSRGF